jgi:hypothetical protein
MLKAIAALAALIVAFGLVACGEKEEPEPVPPETEAADTDPAGDGGAEPGGGGGGAKSPEDEVEAAVQDVLGGGDPAACTELVTARYVRTAYGDEQGCRAAVSNQGRFDVEVDSIRVQGSTATAEAVPDAGPNKGETIAVELVDQGGWKVDSAVSDAPPGP